MSKKVIETPDGFKIKEFDSKGNTKSISEKTYSLRTEAEKASKARTRK